MSQPEQRKTPKINDKSRGNWLTAFLKIFKSKEKKKSSTLEEIVDYDFYV